MEEESTISQNELDNQASLERKNENNNQPASNRGSITSNWYAHYNRFIEAKNLIVKYCHEKQWHEADELYQEIETVYYTFPDIYDFAEGISVSARRLVEAHIIEALKGRNHLHQAEKIYSDIESAHQGFPQNDKITKELCIATFSLIKCYTAFQLEQAEKAYQNIKPLCQRFIDDTSIASGVAAAIFELVIKYCRVDQFQRAEELYNDITSLTQHAEVLIFVSDTYMVRRGMQEAATCLIKNHILKNQKKQASHIYNGLPKNIQFSIAKEEEELDFDQDINLANESILPTVAKEDHLLNSKAAQQQCELIFSQFGIRPNILATDKEYYSDETLLKTVQEKQYFISAESPEQTSLSTSLLIRESRIRYNLMNSNRVQKSSQNNQNLADKIEHIKAEYSETHKGEQPSLHRLASILSERKIASPSGKSAWHAKTVQRVIDAAKDAMHKL
ncbi:hypothetical protein [Spirosoma aerophilum]